MDAGYLRLPRSGRVGKTPKWPLMRRIVTVCGECKESPLFDVFDAREAELWKMYWHKPQAIIWELNGQQMEVALFVRSFVDAEREGATSATRSEVRRLQDGLGLSVAGLRANMWTIVDDAESDLRQPAAGSGAKTAGGSDAPPSPDAEDKPLSARDRLKLVNGSGA